MNNSQDAFFQNKRLGRGVNILGYDPIWRSRSEGRFQEKHFHLIREAGFDHVRINIHPFKYMDDEPMYTIHESWFEILDWAISLSTQNGLLAIIDMHEFIALGKDPMGLRPQFLATWNQISRRYQNAPETVLFEILNEPNQALTADLWNEYYQESYATIRETNPTRTLIIGPSFWNGIEHLEMLKLPDEDCNIIATVHYYHPMSFTHQGAPWTNFKELDIPWLGKAEERQAIIHDLSKAQSWSDRNKRPIYLGEFGAYDQAAMESRARYTSFVARHAESLGWSWGYWQFDFDFVAYDIQKDSWIEPIRDALIPHP